MKVVLSIKPEFADKIFDGTKKYEFRRVIFKNADVKTILVYATSPVKMLVGEFEVENIVSSQLNRLWNQTKKHSGISKEFFFEYFHEKNQGFAIKIKNAKRYRKPKSLMSHYNVRAPQSFLYVS